MLLVLADGGRLAAQAWRSQGSEITVLDHAAYTPCRVAGE
jgi:hypothetical protein